MSNIKKASFLFVTHNRCPNKNFSNNPLTWAFQTLIANKNSHVINEWVVVNDGSLDYTTDNLSWIKKNYNLNIIIIHNAKKRGCSYSRSQGIKTISNDLFFMGDDDCLFRENFVDLSIRSWHKILRHDPKIAVLALPILEMRTTFINLTTMNNIGQSDWEKAWFCHNFDNGLMDYSKDPFQVKTFSGVSLGSKDAFQRAGNFPDLSCWSNDYSEHIEISYQLEKHGHTMYFLPDIKASTTHIKWGTIRNHLLPREDQTYMFPGICHKLGSIMESSMHAKLSGCRVGSKQFLIDRIGSFLAFYFKVSFKSAINYALMEYQSAMTNQYIKGTPSEILELSRNKRVDLWRQGVDKAIKLSHGNNSFDYGNWQKELTKIINL